MAEQSSLTVAVSDGQPDSRIHLSAVLVRSAAGLANHSEPIALSRKATASQALVVVAISCLRQIAQNETGVREGFGEAVHQMRIGLRRLRAALSIFRDAFRPGAFDALKGELVWLTEQLTAAREYDVLLGSRRDSEDFTQAAFAGESELADVLDSRRQEAFATARAAVASARFHRLIVSFTVGLILPADDEDGAGEQLALDLGRKVLERRTRRLVRRLHRFARLGVRERHQLPIEVKKLRYGSEFFASLFPHANRRRTRFSRALTALQDTLGCLNDTTVHQRIAAELVDGGTGGTRASRRVAFAMGGFAQAEKSHTAELLARIPKLSAQLARAPRFWR